LNQHAWRVGRPLWPAAEKIDFMSKWQMAEVKTKAFYHPPSAIWRLPFSMR